MNNYRRLTLKDRYQIQFLKGKSATHAIIARELNVSRPTISKELMRFGGGSYDAEKAQASADRNARERSNANRKIKGDLKEEVDRLIKDDLSPKQAEFKIKDETLMTVSYKSIYRYIERDKLEGGSLKSHLRILRKQRKDRKKPSYRSYQGLVRHRVPITERPGIVEKRERLGDYERDMVLGCKGGPVLLTIVDRKSRYLLLALVRKNNATLVDRATVRLLKNEVRETLTNDNGPEFAYHQKTTKKLGLPIYFSSSYRAWERGTNENTNGLLRQYFPK